MKKNILPRIILSAIIAAMIHPLVGAQSQDERVQWLKKNGFAISSIDPADEDFSDLMPLVKQIGKSRIVMLGEQSHGDGATFLAKCRLVRFLHKVMGFDVLAWESGLYDCWKMDAALRSSKPLQEAIDIGIFGIWGQSGHVRPVFEYAKTTYATKKPLEMAGFDCQFSAPAAPASFQADLTQFLDRADTNMLIAAQKESLKKALVGFQEFRKMTPDERQSLRAAVVDITAAVNKRKSDLLKAHKAQDVDLYLRSLDNFVIFQKMMDNLITNQGKMQGVTDNNSRDQRMGENIVWLAKERYRDRKIMIWAASFHDMRNSSTIETTNPNFSYKGLTTMGQVAYDALGEEIYNIAFTAYDGKAANVWAKDARDIGEASAESLEALLNQIGPPYYFVDFRRAGKDSSHWLRKPILSRPLGYGQMKADWTQIFDAMIFTRTMFPSTKSGEVPEGVKWKREGK